MEKEPEECPECSASKLYIRTAVNPDRWGCDHCFHTWEKSKLSSPNPTKEEEFTLLKKVDVSTSNKIEGVREGFLEEPIPQPEETKENYEIKYQGYCKECKAIISTNFQGDERTPYHVCKPEEQPNKEVKSAEEFLIKYLNDREITFAIGVNMQECIEVMEQYSNHINK